MPSKSLITKWHLNNKDVKVLSSNVFRYSIIWYLDPHCTQMICQCSGQNLRPSVLAILCFAVSIPFFDFLICDAVRGVNGVAGDANFDAESVDERADSVLALAVMPKREATGVERNGERGKLLAIGESLSKTGCTTFSIGAAGVFLLGGILTFFGVTLGFRRRSAASLSPISTAVTFLAPSRVGLGSTFPATFLTLTFGDHASSLA